MGDFVAAHTGEHEKADSGLVPAVQFLKIIAARQHHSDQITVAGQFVPRCHDEQVQLLHTRRPHSLGVAAKLECGIEDRRNNAEAAKDLRGFLEGHRNSLITLEDGIL